MSPAPEPRHGPYVLKAVTTPEEYCLHKRPGDCGAR